MCQITRPLVNRKQKNRSFAIVQPRSPLQPGQVRVTVNGEVTTYAYDVLPVEAEFGRCVLELKNGSKPAYHVLIGSAGVATQCDCMGALRWGKCKHRELAPALLAHTEEREPRQSPTMPIRVSRPTRGFPCPDCREPMINTSDDRRTPQWVCAACLRDAAA